jgi:micrococcal nuclease
MNLKHLLFLTLIPLTAALFLCPCAVSQAQPNPVPVYFPVAKVVDGDTIDVLIDGQKARIRLIGLDTPEVVDPRKPVQCFGREASQRMRELVLGKKARLERDPTQANRDKYGRLLRYVYLPDGTNVAERMIREGYGHECTYQLPYRYQKQFREAERYARDHQLGLWAPDACSPSR